MNEGHISLANRVNLVLRTATKIVLSPRIGVLTGLLTLSVPLVAEQGKLTFHVTDPQGHPVAYLSIRTSGGSGGPQTTDSTGRSVVALTEQTKANGWVTVEIAASPSVRNFLMVSPWNGHILVPSLQDTPDGVVEIVVTERGDKTLLENGKTLAALAAKINSANSPEAVADKSSSGSSRENLVTISKEYGLSPEDVDRAIRAWGKTASTAYDFGLAALYERDYPRAARQLSASLEEGDKALKGTPDSEVDATFFLGQSLYAQGLFSQAATQFKNAHQLRPEDPSILSWEGLSLAESGDLAGAEPLLRRVIEMDETGPDHSDTATNLNNLALLLWDKGDYAGAEPLYRRALAMDEKELGPDHPGTATSLSNLALLLQDKGDYAEAEPLYRRALAIDEKALGPDQPDTANTLRSLAGLLRRKGDYAGAEPLYRRALAIDEKALGPEHPSTATSLNNLARLLEAKGEYVEAEVLFRRALAIHEKVLGPDHPNTAVDLNNLAGLLKIKEDKVGAEQLYRQALAIDEKALGPDHPGTAIPLNNLALLLLNKGDYAEAEPLLRRALAINERVLGPDHPTTATALNNLAALLNDKRDYAEAEPLYRRSLAIREKSLGPNHPETAASYYNLASLLENEGKYAEAELMYRRVLEIREKTLGPNDPKTKSIEDKLFKMKITSH
jgi:tetratricopeptide (TPR) repeat protein